MSLNLAFYTVADQKFLKGALPLMRSVQQYYPEARRYLLTWEMDQTSQSRLAREELTVIDISSQLPESELLSNKQSYFGKYCSESIDADYLVHIDADAVLSGRVDEILNNNSSHVGFVTEEYLGFTVKDQFDSDKDLDRLLDEHGVSADGWSLNTGVFCGSRDAFSKLSNSVMNLLTDDLIARLTRTDQGVVALALLGAKAIHQLGNQCNMIDEYWDGHTPSVIHFAGWPRPWICGRARPDNSYPAFAEWRKHSKLGDFQFPKERLRELFWRSLDDLRPWLRRMRKKDQKGPIDQ